MKLCDGGKADERDPAKFGHCMHSSTVRNSQRQHSLPKDVGKHLKVPSALLKIHVTDTPA